MKMRSGATPSPSQDGLDQVHERPGAADVAVGVEVRASDEGGHIVGREEPAVGIVVVAHLESVPGGARLQSRPAPGRK